MELRDFAEMQKIKKKTEYISNPNLLDNWYFADPINQRGQTEYVFTAGVTTSVHGIDRWAFDANGGEVKYTQKNGFGRLEKTAIGNNAQSMYQNIKKERLIAGETYTISALCRGTGYSQIIILWDGVVKEKQLIENTANFSLHHFSFVVPEGIATNIGFFFYTHINDGELGYTDFKAVKLELGSQQTLAHQENGVWMLNEIPNYAEQMAICSQYSPTSGEYLGAGVFIRHDTTGKLYRLGLDDNGLYTVEQS